MKKKTLSLTLALTALVSLTASAQLVVTNFSDWANPQGLGWSGINNGWNVSNPGALTTQGGAGNYQFGGVASNVGAYEGGTVNLTVDFTALSENVSGSGFLRLNAYDDSFALIQTFQWNIASNLAGGAVNLSGILNAGNYENLFVLELTTTGLSVPLNDTFSASFSNLSFTAVPEPSTYGLLILGAGAIVVMVRRRRTA